jgi:predicted RNA-binding Zn ribbon-like protein
MHILTGQTDFTGYIYGMTFSWTSHRFAGGALALDVANSVILRSELERRIDRFDVPQQLEAFPKAALQFSAERALFGSLDPVRPENRTGFLSLREAIDAYFRKRVEGRDDRLLLADLLTAAAGVLRHSPGVASLEAATARSAIRLLADAETERLKICGNCGWLFLDRSRNRSRMWCDMAVCGNRAKASRHYHRKRREAAS